ncbi:transcriptional regulator [Bacillus thuringiensis]|uniref:helix-turn-helix domain-containing protein n=1 Tax=Bacillus thuringiensis TaxID=1428 RepID=UPI000BEE3032|nr:helix-turn-helix transcriptional regulator [Bacillus thuringiensis]PEF03421.1 transcriptional regulator [Bacillus thuringiensis]
MNNLKYVKFDSATQDDPRWEKAKYKTYNPLHECNTPTGIRFELKEYLEDIGLSQRSLAELSGLNQPTINDICENRALLLNVTHLVRICSVLGCDLSDIMRTVPIQNTEYTESDSVHNLKQKEKATH